jgi:phage baseplate assembly protein gpV
MIKFAEVKSRNLEKGTVRVTFKEDDDLESYDLPVLQMSTQASKALALPDVGEQVAVSMDKNMVDGCVLGCLYNDTDAAPSGGSVVDGYYIKMAGGTVIRLSKADKVFEIGDGDSTFVKGTDGALEVKSDSPMVIASSAESLGPLIQELIDEIKLLTVPTGTGPSGTPINAPQFTALATRFESLLAD